MGLPCKCSRYVVVSQDTSVVLILNVFFLVPSVSFAVGSKTYTVNPSEFAFGDAGNGMIFGGVSQGSAILMGDSLTISPFCRSKAEVIIPSISLVTSSSRFVQIAQLAKGN